jgi:VWFA-related protein
MSLKLLPLISSFSLFLWVFLIPDPVNGQDIPEAPLIRAHVDVVNVLATVKNRRGHYVQDLNIYDFEIFEDQIRQRLEFFNYETGQEGRSLTIVVLIDTSGSVKQELAFEQKAAIEFLRSTLREKKDLAAVVQFDSDVNLVQGFTFDLEQLESRIHTMIPPGGATKLYDAIVIATEDMLRHEVGRKVIIVLSDGADTQSFYSSKDAIKSAQDRDVIIFGIGVRDRAGSSDFGQLRKFAEATGGTFFKSKASLSRIREAFAKINQEIKNQVSLGYVSTNVERDGTFRSIRVKVKRRGVKVRHRKGYYAPGEGSPAEK